MTETTLLYMFAIMPPEDLTLKIHGERMNFAEEYKFITALKPPVHITLLEPFSLPYSIAREFEHNIGKLQNWADRQKSFGIELKDFDFFDNAQHPVIYIDVVTNQNLKDLHSSFLKEIKKYLDLEKKKNNLYKPHITIGYRDVTPQAFPAIKEAYSKRWFRETFHCSSFFLWKHNGKKWLVHEEFKLKEIIKQQELF